jgi:LPS-assembly protein
MEILIKIKGCRKKLLFSFVFCVSVALNLSELCFAQAAVSSGKVALPDSRELFASDRRDVRKKEEKKIQAAISEDTAALNRLDFKAPNVQFDKEANTVSGQDGVSISGMGVRVQSDVGTLDLDSNDTNLKGNVVVTDQEAAIEADSGTFNFETETGEFSNARFTMEQGGYQFQSGHLSKTSETKYFLTDLKASNCACETETPPWQISARECNITQEGYAHAYDTTFRLYGVPVFYTPYLGIPAKIERASGLLAPQLGFSRENGFQMRQPVYTVIDDSSDSIITPFIETRTRQGFFLDYRREQSRYHSGDFRFLYSDETLRDGDLRGTVTEGIVDPKFDESRFGLLYQHTWTTEPDPDYSLGYFADVHYVGDNLLLRELEDSGIGTRQSLFTVSTAAVRSTIGQHISAELVGEYNQNLIGNQDYQLHRLPTANIDALKTFRVFGENPYGMKLITKASANSVTFSRDQGFDGTRNTVAPSIAVPFRVKNYLNSSLALSVDQTYYSLRDRDQVGNPDIQLKSSASRTLPAFSYSASTGVERVYTLDKDSSLTQLTMLGKDNQENYLARVKHTVDPEISFLYVPDVSQAENPLFDGYDRQNERALLRYGLSTRMLGRFVPRLGSTDDIPEIAPRPQDLPMFDTTRPLSELGSFGSETMEGALFRAGEIRELASFSISQGYDFKERSDDNSPAFNDNSDGVNSFRNPGIRPATDVRSVLGLYPTSNVALSFENYYDPYDNSLNNWIFGTALSSDRGDILRARYFYYRNPTTGAAAQSQIETNAELVVVPGLRAGYYARYDFEYKEPGAAANRRTGDFIEQRMALRLIPDCDCWFFDIGFIDTVNPDRQLVLFSINFGGLGAINQNVLVNRDRDPATR